MGAVELGGVVEEGADVRVGVERNSFKMSRSTVQVQCSALLLQSLVKNVGGFVMSHPPYVVLRLRFVRSRDRPLLLESLAPSQLFAGTRARQSPACDNQLVEPLETR